MSPTTGWHRRPTPARTANPVLEMVSVKGIRHSYVMVGLVVAGGALYFSGIGAGAVYLLWPLACVAMMVVMMRGMGGMGKPAQHTHPDGVTHSHDDDTLTDSHRGGGTTW